MIGIQAIGSSKVMRIQAIGLSRGKSQAVGCIIVWSLADLCRCLKVSAALVAGIRMIRASMMTAVVKMPSCSQTGSNSVQVTVHKAWMGTTHNSQVLVDRSSTMVIHMVVVVCCMVIS